jgi:hypothetical protein
VSNENFTDCGPSIPNNAVSIYGQGDAMDDFPVLKAFQQYIDAEQAKAQKRMTTLCIFFAIILAIVIGVFVLLLLNIGQRNNSLNEQLFQYMMKERDRPAPVVTQAPQQSDAAIRALADTMASFQKQLTEQQMRVAEQQTRMLEQQNQTIAERAKKMSEPPVDHEAELETSRQNKAEALRLKKALAELNAEKERLAREKDRLHEKEIELYRKEHYSDVKPAPVVMADDEDTFEDEDDEFPEQEAAPVARPVSPAPAVKKPVAAKPKSASVKPAAKPAPKLVPAVKKKGAETPFYDIPDDDSDLDSLLGIPSKGVETQSDGTVKYFDEPEPAAKPAPPVATTSTMHLTDDWQFPLD